MNNTITWKNHLYGYQEHPGLLPTLSKPVGILAKLKKYMKDAKFKKISSGLFLSKLNYRISVWSGIWDSQHENSVKTSISKKDMRKLQTLQNKTLRLETRLNRYTSTKDLISSSNSLSVHQLAAKSCLTQLFNIKKNRKPKYHYDRLFRGSENRSTQINLRSTENINTRI